MAGAADPWPVLREPHRMPQPLNSLEAGALAYLLCGEHPSLDALRRQAHGARSSLMASLMEPPLPPGDATGLRATIEPSDGHARLCEPRLTLFRALRSGLRPHTRSGTAAPE